MRWLIVFSLVEFFLISCKSTIGLSTYQSSIVPIPQAGTYQPTIFLLERDIPNNIERLGIVLINIGTASNVDKQVKEQLRIRCKELDANGAYRLREGFYPDASTISYLVFKYKQ